MCTKNSQTWNHDLKVTKSAAKIEVRPVLAVFSEISEKLVALITMCRSEVLQAIPFGQLLVIASYAASLSKEKQL